MRESAGVQQGHGSGEEAVPSWSVFSGFCSAPQRAGGERGGGGSGVLVMRWAAFPTPLQSLYHILYSIIVKGSEQWDHKVLLVSPILSLRCRPRVNHTHIDYADLWERQE